MPERPPNRHHILFNATAWESNVHTNWLREHSGLIVRMDCHAHQELHDNITVVPLLDHYSAAFVRSAMERSRASKPLDRADDFMLALESYGQELRANRLDRSLGALVIEAVEGQREYIEDGLVRAQVYDLGRRSPRASRGSRRR
jgi:hypothetical protein